jgi:hypothetical protein
LLGLLIISSEWKKSALLLLLFCYNYLFSLFLVCACLHMLCRKDIQENKYGGDTPWPQKHNLSRKLCNLEDNRSRTTYGKVGPEGTPWVATWLGSWQASPPPPPLSPRFVHGQVWAQYTLIIYISSFVSVTPGFKEQNQVSHMCVQEVHTYVRIKKVSEIMLLYSIYIAIN